MDTILYSLFGLLVLIFSAVIHEYAHGWVADILGDPTAKYAGRLTVNPIAHVDLWGTILMPIMLLVLTKGSFLFAYAKPVPYNPYNLKNQKWGPVMVALAGPIANLLLAVAFSVVVRILFVYNPESNLISTLAYIVQINVMLMVFNLVPIPPLDGSKLLYALLPNSASNIKNFLDRYGFMILLFFVFFLFELISPIIQFIFRLLVG